MRYQDVLHWLPDLARAPQHYDLFRCPACELVYCDTYPPGVVDFVESSACYEEKIIAPYLERMQPIVDETLAARVLDPGAEKSTSETHWSRLLEILAHHGPSHPRIAEVGSCYGAFAQLMNHALRPADLLACETNRKFLGKLRARYPHLRTTSRLIEDWPTGEMFDLIYCSDVIEHIWDFRGFLRAVSRHLEAGGHLVVVTPNIAGDAAQAAGTQWWGYLVPHHCQLFSAESLRAAGSPASLVLVEATPSFEEIIVVFQKTSLPIRP